MEKKIYTLVMDAISEFNVENKEYRIDISKGIETPLYGHKGMLDSLGLVNLIVLIEQKLEDDMGKVLRIVSERAVSQKNSPFLTVDTLTKFIIILIEEGE